jgi:hypothetical protein
VEMVSIMDLKDVLGSFIGVERSTEGIWDDILGCLMLYLVE